MPAVEWPGYEKLQQKLARLAQVPEENLKELGEALEKILIEDNRRGVLAGLDKDGNPLAPVTYRGSSVKPPTARGGTKKFGKHGGTFEQRAKAATRSTNYKSLTGPPLAPNGAQSRVITHLVVDSTVVGGNSVEATVTWKGVVSAKGVEFLQAHFNGSVVGKQRFKLKVRDLRGVRPWGKQQAKELIRAWANKLIGK